MKINNTEQRRLFEENWLIGMIHDIDTDFLEAL
ncbi:MAG: hypothetical protein J07HQW2_02349 [Haloquadratum walsbyi J07HQW2]|uniref:Uncharacterized protein n=1 Tax=Haloquadratum walsbyi J07HQW2 TaxID=1238425 RepID=U1MZG5_9EURY|nr:MAG: hypothetical protein J07HQW2_02349 [Haloquadratum walsbyi J07HQW2]